MNYLLGNLTLVKHRDLIIAELSFSDSSITVYFGKCTIWVTVLLEYLDCLFSICGCHRWLSWGQGGHGPLSGHCLVAKD